MEKTLKLQLHETGKWSTVNDGGDVLGTELESGATSLYLYLPKSVLSLSHFIDVKLPDGTCLESKALTAASDDDGSYISIAIGSPLTSQVGRIAFQYVGKDANANKKVKSDIFNLDINESIEGEFSADQNSSDFWGEWQKDIDDLEARVVACEDKADGADTKSDTAINTANSANTLATEAKGQAVQAAKDAASASASAKSAQDSATSAQSSAATAGTKADDAKASADAAASSAQAATSAATSAANLASAANSTATEAKTIATTANGTANDAKAIAQGAVDEVTALLTAKETLTGPYIQLKNPKEGELIHFHIALKSGSNVQLKMFWGKNFWNVKGMTLSVLDGHSGYAYGPLVVPSSQYLYLTIPDGYKLIIRELDGLAYKSTEGNLIQEDVVTTSGPIILNGRTVGKSIRIFLSKIVSDAETMPTAADLEALAPLTSLSYGTSAIPHYDYISPTILGPYSYSANGSAVDVDSEAKSATGNVAVVPLADTGADADYPNSYISYLTTDLADKVAENAEKNLEQDERLATCEANIAALQSISGDLVLAVEFVGDEISGTKLLGNSDQVFDLSTGKNTYQTLQWFMGINYDLEEKAVLSDGTEIIDPDTSLAAIMHFVMFSWYCFRLQTGTDADGNVVKTYYFSPTVRAGYTPIGQFSDGSYPAGFLVGKYGTSWLDKAALDCAGPFKNKLRTINRNPNQLLALAKAPYIKDSVLGLASPSKVDQWADPAYYTTMAILEMVCFGTRNAQDLFPGINGDGTFYTGDDATIKALQPTGTVNYLYIPTSNYIVTKLKARYTAKSDYGYIQVLESAYWGRYKVAGVTDSTPSSGYTKIELTGASMTPSSGTRISLNWGYTGQTASITTGFGNEDGDGSGYQQCQIFGVEASHGDLWQYEKGFVRILYSNATYTRTVYLPEFAKVDPETYNTSNSDNVDSGIVGATVDSGWVKEIAFGGRVYYPTTVGASSATGYCDYTYNDKPTLTEGATTDRELLVGGSGNTGSYGGPFCLHGVSGCWSAYWYIGARCFKWLPAKQS